MNSTLSYWLKGQRRIREEILNFFYKKSFTVDTGQSILSIGVLVTKSWNRRVILVDVSKNFRTTGPIRGPVNLKTPL